MLADLRGTGNNAIYIISGSGNDSPYGESGIAMRDGSFSTGNVLLISPP
jgi:hypothetical protein